jgi:hypothetical protein
MEEFFKDLLFGSETPEKLSQTKLREYAFESVPPHPNRLLVIEHTLTKKAVFEVAILASKALDEEWKE